MNKDSYAALSPTQKAAFDKLTGKVLALRAAKIFDDWAEQAFKLAQDGKQSRSSSFPEVRKTMFDAAKPVVDKIIADIEKDGIAGSRARPIRR